MGRRVQNDGMFQAEEASKPQPSPSFDAAKVKEHAGVQYRLEGIDATILNGRFQQKRVSELIKTSEGKDYLGSLWRVAHPDLQRVIKAQFDI
jgi:hypothetical protein